MNQSDEDDLLYETLHRTADGELVPLKDSIRLAIREAYAKGAEDAKERAAKVCEEIENLNWRIYKGVAGDDNDRQRAYNPHTEGVSDGAGECAAAIRRG